MNAVQTRQPAEITADFSADMVKDFIAFIDRSDRTAQAYWTNLRQFMAWLHYAGVQQPTRADIIAYRDYLLTEHWAIELAPGTAAGYAYRTDNAGNRYRITCKPGTAAQYLRSVGQLFKWAAACGIYPDIAANVHAPKIDHGTHKKEALLPADVPAIERSIAAEAERKVETAAAAAKDTAGRMERATEQGKRLYAMFLLSVTAGLRTIELSRANVRDLEVKGGRACLYVWGKGHTEPDAKHPLAKEVYEALQDYLRSRTDKPTGSSPLFVATGNRSGGKRIEARTIGQMLKRAMIEAGYNSERITAHSLRHTAGTAVMEITGDIYMTQRYMRHSNPATTEIYLHNNTEAQEAHVAQEVYNVFHAQEVAEVTEPGRVRVNVPAGRVRRLRRQNTTAAR